MAEYDLSPIEIDEDLQGTYDLLRGYFIRGNNLFNIVADYVGTDTFTIDIVRSYSVIASTHRASVHITGTPIENGTRIDFHCKSVETQERLEVEIRDRVEEVLGHLLEEKRGLPVVDKNDTSDPAKEKRNMITTIVVLGIIAIGAGLSAVLQQFSGAWII
jgi:hypothetical protein